jgi:DNA-binding IclR family transcriptional regulator
MNVALENKSAHHLLTFLCIVANSVTGLSWHSQASMKRTGMKPATIRKATQVLVKLGLVTCESKGRNTSLRYTVNYEKLVQLAEVGKTFCAERRKIVVKSK